VGPGPHGDGCTTGKRQGSKRAGDDWADGKNMRVVAARSDFVSEATLQGCGEGLTVDGRAIPTAAVQRLVCCRGV